MGSMESIRRKVQSGRCEKCGRRTSGTWRCAPCREKHRAYTNDWYERRGRAMRGHAKRNAKRADKTKACECSFCKAPARPLVGRRASDRRARVVCQP